jgi:hypothetical protein
MKKCLLILVAAAVLTSVPSYSFAKNYTMVFWYPGEQGSTAEAEPVLTSFFDYLNKKLKGSKFSGKYFNTTSSGIIYIKKTKPAFGIASAIALRENNGTLPAYNRIASTLPLPHGTISQQFTLVGISPPEGEETTPPTKTTIYTSLPISMSFLKSKLFPDLQGTISIQNTNTMLMTLKKIASSGDSSQVALLTPIEKFTIDQIKSEWAQSLKSLQTSHPIATAPLVYFGEKPEISNELVKVLAAMPADTEGKEILETLRLKGFKPAI